MLSMYEFEKLIYKEETEQKVEIKPIVSTYSEEFIKTSAKEFFKTYRNRYLLIQISEYLSDSEKINLLYLNRLTLINFKRIYNETLYKELKLKLFKLSKKGYTLRNLLENNAKLLKENINLEKLYENKEDLFCALNLMGKWLNKFYFLKKVISEETEKFENSYESTINLCNNSMDLSGAKILFFIIAHNHIIEEIDISNNNLPEQTFNFFKFASKKIKSLKILYLHDNNFGNELGINYFVENLHFIQNLTILNMSNINMNEESAIILSEKINILKNLEILNMDNNEIKSGGAGRIFKSCKNLNKLISITLRATNINEYICDALHDFMEFRKVLAHLNLSNNPLGAKFCRKFGKNFNNFKVLSLELENCNFDNMGISILITHLIPNEHLEFLNLNDNEFTPDCMNHVKGYLKKNEKIKRIKIGKKEITKDTK